MKSGQGTVSHLSGHYTHYIPADSRPAAPNTDPAPGGKIFMYNMFVPWVWFCLGDYPWQGQLSVCKTSCGQVVEVRKQSTSLGQDPRLGASHPPLTLQRSRQGGSAHLTDTRLQHLIPASSGTLSDLPTHGTWGPREKSSRGLGRCAVKGLA